MSRWRSERTSALATRRHTIPAANATGTHPDPSPSSARPLAARPSSTGPNAAAYRELVASDKRIHLRPWLYTIARNRCRTVLRARRERPLEDAEEPATEHLAAVVQRRQDLRDLLRDLHELPEHQRAALVLAEAGDVSWAEP